MKHTATSVLQIQPTYEGNCVCAAAEEGQVQMQDGFLITKVIDVTL